MFGIWYSFKIYYLWQHWCKEYGVALDDDDIQEIKDLADQDGEIHKVDFILHIKNSRLLKHFETVDPYSRIHWKKKADLAFRHN